MEKYLRISSKDLLKELIDLKNFSFIQNGCIIRFKEHAISKRYYYKLDSDDYQIFNNSVDILWNEMLGILDYNSKKYIYVLAYEDNWQQSALFDVNKLSKGKFAIQTDCMNVLREIFNMSMKYQAFPVFIAEDLSLAIIPTDHLDLFIAYTNSCNSDFVVMNENLELTAWE